MSTLLKTLWFGLISLLVGPFALWFILDGKQRRRGLLPNYLGRFLVSVTLFLVFHVLLFLAPIHWTGLLAFYLMACATTIRLISSPARAALFKLPTDAAPPRMDRPSFFDSFLTTALAIFPLVYILALVHNIGELGNFSIRLPSDVYTGGLLWMAYSAPGVLLASWVAWKGAYKPGLRALIYFYGAVIVVLLWIMVWERMDQVSMEMFGIPDREPLLFSFEGEARWRTVVKSVFYGSAFLLGVAYLIGAARTSVFAKRALLLGLPSLMLYVNMLFFLGDWNLYLGAFRDGSYSLHHYSAYRMAVGAQLARTPAAYRAPFLREEWADLEYQSGRVGKSRTLMARLVEDGRRHPYHARLGKRAERSLANLERPHGAPILLDLPVIKPASYLDREWYALLGAVAFLKPDWTDLDLRKRLLDLSSTVQLHLPELDNLPELAPAFRQLQIPISPCFLTKERAIEALKAGNIPFLSLYGHWVPLSGYDPGRDGFYYYSYRETQAGSGMFRNEDVDLFHHLPGESFGGRKGTRGLEESFSLQKFIPAEELERHILDIGGVAVVLGDSTFIPARERRAAFLVEQGDVHYQDHDNYEDAAACYREAADLIPHDQVLSRMLYLKRRYRDVASDPRDYRNLFRDYPPRWMEGFGPSGPDEKALMARILEGRLGAYVLMNWHKPPPPAPSPEAKAALDTSLALFTSLNVIDPYEPLYMDSLAALRQRSGDLPGSERLYEKLASLYPFGNEYAEFRLAWVKFKLGKTAELADVLERCSGFAEDARYLTMQGALAMSQGKDGKAFDILSKSLKLDKSLGETHALLADYHKRRGESEAESVHRLWLKRST